MGVGLFLVALTNDLQCIVRRHGFCHFEPLLAVFPDLYCIADVYCDCQVTPLVPLFF